jgi:DNA-directed RNA polymerase I, II, and III subunit RPABC1
MEIQDQIVRKTCIEMLQQRGYLIEQDDDEALIGTKDKQRIIVFFNESTKLDVERVKEYIDLMYQSDIHHAVVVMQETVTPVAKKVVEELPQSNEHLGYIIELFEAKSLRYNITKHRLVPRHTVLGKSESSSFRQTYGTKLPALLRSDPIARFYFYQRGDVVKIERNDGFVSFRIVK